MSLYYIAMGQGIIGQGPIMKKKKITINNEDPWERVGPNFYVQTSSLPSCTFICGFNSETKRGGAFHYPNGLFSRPLEPDNQVVIDGMEAWILSLNPTEMTLVGDKGERGRVKEDEKIHAWLGKHNISFEIPFVDCGFGAIRIKGNRKTGIVGFMAGKPEDQRHPKEPLPFDMRGLAADTYHTHEPLIELFGKDTSGGAHSTLDRPELRDYDEDSDSDSDSSESDTSESESESESDDENSEEEGGNDDSSKLHESKATDDPKEVTK